MSSAYDYKPFLPAAVVGIALFTIVTGYQLFVCVQQKTGFFWFILLGTFMEISGLGLRVYSAVHPTEERKAVISYILLIISPSLIGAALFTIFDRVMWYTTPPFRRKFSTTWFPSGLSMTLFKVLYITSILLGFIGGGGRARRGSSSSSSRAQSLSGSLLHIGFFIQAVCMAFFALVCTHFIIISRTWQPSTLFSISTPPRSWKLLLYATTGSAILMVLRTTYRILEFSDSNPKLQAYIQRHEYTYWSFDAALVLGVLVLFAVFHPGYCLPVEYTKFWFRKRKIRKVEAKTLQSQTWPPVGWKKDDDEEKGNANQQVVDQWEVTVPGGHHGEGDPVSRSPAWPTSVHLPSRN